MKNVLPLKKKRLSPHPHQSTSTQPLSSLLQPRVSKMLSSHTDNICSPLTQSSDHPNLTLCSTKKKPRLPMISKLLNPAVSSPCLSYAPSSVSGFEDSLGYLKATNVTALPLNWSWLGSPSSRGFPSSNQLTEFIWSHPQHLFPSYLLCPICQQVHCFAFEIFKLIYFPPFHCYPCPSHHFLSLGQQHWLLKQFSSQSLLSWMNRSWVVFF